MNEETKRNIENLLATKNQKVILTEEIARQIIPIDNSANQFFYDSARVLVKGVITVLMLTRPNWTFKDVIKATRTKDQLRLTLLQSEETKHLVEHLFTDEKTINIIFPIIQKNLEG
jgi:hypothetical protein